MPCRNFIMCDQDQWDIHKLDPFYDCFVPTPPRPPTIRAKVMSTPSFASSSASSQSSVFADGSQKRRLSTPTSSFEEEENGHSPKKRRHVIHVDDSDSDQVKAETIVNPNVHRSAPRTYVPGRRVHERKRGTRYVPIARTTQINAQDPTSSVPPDEDMRSITPPRAPPQTTAPPSTSKRRKGTDCSIHTPTH
jgi:hypothetical protein